MEPTQRIDSLATLKTHLNETLSKLKQNLNNVYILNNNASGMIESESMPIGYWLLLGQTMAIEKILIELEA